MTTISQTPNIRNIQGEIADLLGLKLEEETEQGRARRIAMRLQGPEEKILIILDDVWAMLNLEDIGIPFRDKGPRNCKVILTTRRQEVCTSMYCLRTIPLGLLTEDEAWDLFQTHAKVDSGTRELAQEVVAECNGLPIAIVAMAKCLKGKGLDLMNVVLHRLRHSKPIDEDKAFTCLKLSYDYLTMVEAKLLFLMCAIFPEDHEIIIEDLFRYGVGLGLCDGVGNSFEIARSHVGVAMDVLIDSSLLMYSVNSKNEKCVKMHDMIHDVALRIAPKELGTIVVNASNEFLEDEAVKDCYAVSSWNKSVTFLQSLSRLDAPKLELLLLHSNEPQPKKRWYHPETTLQLPCASFEGVKGLKVVALINSGIFSGPKFAAQSMQQFSNLRTLRLQYWNLGDISFVVCLKRLEILDLEGSRLKELPNGIEHLNRLKLLDLSDCVAEECFCKVIGRCSQLEELYIFNKVLLAGCQICYECFVGVLVLPKLRRYAVEIGQYVPTNNLLNKGSRELFFNGLNIISILGCPMMKDLAQRAVAIEFYMLEGGKTFIPDVAQTVGSMNELTKLCFEHCYEIECIIDQMIPDEDIVIPRFIELVLKSMGNLKQLSRGPSNVDLFQNLESLNIESCPRLVSMFPVKYNLGNLKFLSIVNCPMLTSVFPISVSCTLSSLEELKIGRCHGLKSVIESEDGVDTWEEDMIFPKWKILSVRDCGQLEFIGPSVCVQGFVHLKSLLIRDTPQLKFVFGEETSICDENQIKIVLPLLEEIYLISLPNLHRICSESYHLLWPSIKNLYWKHCPRLNASCDSPNMEPRAFNGHEMRNEEYQSLEAVSNVESIDIFNCGVVSAFIPQIPTFQYLKELNVEKCAKLKFVVSASMFQSLPELTSITLSSCEEMEQVFLRNEETQQENQSPAQFYLPNLESLKIKQCNKLKSIFPFMISDAISMLPKLRTLSISHASQLEEIFICSNIEGHDTESEREIMFPNSGLVTLEELPTLANFCQGYTFQISKHCSISTYKCPKLVPNLGASAKWIGEKLVRKHVLKCSQLENNEGLSPPLVILNSEELDNLSGKVKDSCRVIGDNKDSEMLNLDKMLEGKTPKQRHRFQFLHSLDVDRCNKLKFLFSASTIVNNSLPKLKSLSICRCEELEEIISGNDVPDQNTSNNAQGALAELRDLRIQSCNKLKRLFSATITTILPQLHTLQIIEASQLEVMFGHEKEDDANNGEKIVLPNLSEVKLLNLPKFVNICQGLLQFEAVELDSISIYMCPNFLNPTFGSTQMVSLQEGKLMDSRGVEDKEMIMISNVSFLALEYSADLMTILWEGPTLISFQNLSRLKVVRCIKLKSIFPRTVIKSLSCLRSLTIQECEDLEEIVSENDHFPSPSSSNSSLCFPKLRNLEVVRCRKLKCLFSFPYNGDLAMLQSLRIRECSEIEQVFSCDLEIHEQESNKNLLPNLKHLILQKLPKLTDICANVPFLLKFWSLEIFRVDFCPMFQNTDGVEESPDYYSDTTEDYGFRTFEDTRTFLHFHDRDFEE